jgi:hypothetical protein
MIYRYEPRFYLALQKALANHKPIPHARLWTWVRQIERLTAAVVAAADAVGMDSEARKALVLHLDKRDITMDRILAVLLYHARQEYPFLLGNGVEHNLTALYATNLNDRYLALRLGETVEQEAVKKALIALQQHLADIPQT